MNAIGLIKELVSLPKSRRAQSLAISVSLLFVVIFSLKLNGFIGDVPSFPTTGEIDLSGEWKISFQDTINGHSPSMDDRDWCQIMVPDSGLTPKEESNRAKYAKTCPKEAYPKELMRNHTYWYRKEVIIPEGFKWDRPALFIGSIKREGWVFWDGELIGTGRYEMSPTVILIKPDLVKPGHHLLAVRVTSESESYPGIFHGFERKVTLGELERSLSAVASARRIDYLEPFAVVTLQIAALLVMIYLIARSKTANGAFFWLAVYSGSAALYAAAQPLRNEWKWFLTHSSFIGMSISMSGYGSTIFDRIFPSKFPLKATLLFVTLFSLSLEISAFAHLNSNWMGASHLHKVIAIYSLAYFCFLFVRSHIHREVRSRFQVTDYLTVAVMFFLHLIHFADQVITASRAVGWHSALASSILTVIVVLLAVEEHMKNERTLAFFGRFIRPGLRQLLAANRQLPESRRAWIRGRKIPILKVDIVGHTDATYGMPFGAKRVFQDTWFTCVDQVVADKVFFDKGEGDGSIYYFEPDLPGGSCSQALEVAELIRDKTAKEFDEEFKSRIANFMQEAPTLERAMEMYCEAYKEKNKEDFWQRKTKVRFVLLFGYADDGLCAVV